HAPATTASYALPYTTLFRSRVEVVLAQLDRLFQGLQPLVDQAKGLLLLLGFQELDVFALQPGHLERLVEVDHGDTVQALGVVRRSEEHTSELQSRSDLVCRL